jgi:hypothetical protein
MGFHPSGTTPVVRLPSRRVATGLAVLAAAVAYAPDAGAQAGAPASGLSGGGGATMPLGDSPRGSREVILEQGDRGVAVKRLQRRLRVRPRSGLFGARTHRAVKRFQRRAGLPATGKVGPATRRALRLARFSRASVVKARRRPSRSRVRVPRILRLIAECESGGDPTAVSPDGRYRGKYQFARETWKIYGGRGDDPAEASEAEQDRVALRLYRAEGNKPWPNCPRRS